jgi:TrpR family transcriptional regulator, trp operon repressor
MAIDRQLLQVVSTINDLDELERFFMDLFTPAELDDIALRWKLLKDLHRGLTQRKIAQKYRISLCKITRGSKVLKKKDSMVGKVLHQLDDTAGQ